MGKIFGISDNPVSTISSALKTTASVEPPKIFPTKVLKNIDTSDKFISIEKTNTSNAFVKMRNGIGRLMSHFSKSGNLKSK